MKFYHRSPKNAYRSPLGSGESIDLGHDLGHDAVRSSKPPSHAIITISSLSTPGRQHINNQPHSSRPLCAMLDIPLHSPAVALSCSPEVASVIGQSDFAINDLPVDSDKPTELDGEQRSHRVGLWKRFKLEVRQLHGRFIRRIQTLLGRRSLRSKRQREHNNSDTSNGNLHHLQVNAPTPQLAERGACNVNDLSLHDNSVEAADLQQHIVWITNMSQDQRTAMSTCACRY